MPETAPSRRWLSIVGIGEDGTDGLSPTARELVARADIVFGGARHLALAAALIEGEAKPWPSPFSRAVDEVLALVRDRPELGEPLPGTEDYLKAEVVYAVTHEGARHLDDVLARRTRISIETFDRGVAAAQPAAELMAGPLGWDEAHVAEEVDHYLRRVAAERDSQSKLTDQEADEARVTARDVLGT